MKKIGIKKIWKHRYQVLEQKGTGGSGSVYKVWDLHLEKEWAMKILENKWENNWNEDAKNEITENMNEKKALKQISHPNFPRIVDAFEEEGRSILIMDYIKGVTLEEVIQRGPIKEEEMKDILFQVCDALLYLHQFNPILLYLDLKPANIMIEENKTVKLIDLGSISIKGISGKISGSLGYASPEQIQLQREGRLLKEQSDIFSFGMVLYAMATGSCDRLPVIDGKSRHGVFIRRDNPFLSVSLEKIIEKCTRGNPNRRYGSMREVKKDMENWERGLKKRKFMFESVLFKSRSNKKQWYQEKSIFCTEGRHSFYIAKKIMLLFICFMCLMPGKVSFAGEKNNYGKAMEEQKNLKCEDGKERELGVIIRDYKLRKILVKRNCVYETAAGILLEIPWEEIEGNYCKILVECEEESGIKKQFFIECCYRK